MDGKRINQDPMQMPTWPLGMAMAWIACRETSGASEIWRSSLEAALLDEAELKANQPFLEAEKTLINALNDGVIAATGLLEGQRIAVPQLQWEDMKISYGFAADDSLMHRATNAAGAMYTELRVNRSDILALWPAMTAVVTTDRRRGPKGGKLDAVKTAMIDYNNTHGDLASMKEAVMEARFGASRDTCRKARDQVLGSVAN
ncbi:hypothetical protein ABIF64_006852 [Bradyrhizobium japonicum]|uniref:hypothetical protein n=1 Tax=Bradyrhizobium japonicum TaxID=375 RepID=UPI003398434F